MRTYNSGEVRAILKLHLATNYDLKSDAAKEWGISRSYLSQILSGESPIPNWLLDILKLERVQPAEYYKRLKK